MSVTFGRPRPDDTCPLTLLPICSDALSFAPGLTFFPDSPDLRMLTLPCGHAFGALNLVFHFCKSKMQCPLCRGGFTTPMDPRKLPAHLIDPILDVLIQDDEDDDDDDSEFDVVFWLLRIWHSRRPHPVILVSIVSAIASVVLILVFAALSIALLMDIAAVVAARVLLPFILFGGFRVH
jgi:hypothetical protein